MQSSLEDNDDDDDDDDDEEVVDDDEHPQTNEEGRGAYFQLHGFDSRQDSCCSG